MAAIDPSTFVPERRAFLRQAGVLCGTLWASSTALIALAPQRSWALSLTNLSTDQGDTLLRLARHIFPHSNLDDAVYAFVVRDLDAAAQDATGKALLLEGIKALHDAAGGNWLTADSAHQSQTVHTIAGQPFFEKVRSTAIVSLYNNELAFAHFGYQGNAFKQGGGYLQRGFNDLQWLPAPPPEASPAPA